MNRAILAMRLLLPAAILSAMLASCANPESAQPDTIALEKQCKEYEAQLKRIVEKRAELREKAGSMKSEDMALSSGLMELTAQIEAQENRYKDFQRRKENGEFDQCIKAGYQY